MLISCVPRLCCWHAASKHFPFIFAQQECKLDKGPACQAVLLSTTTHFLVLTHHSSSTTRTLIKYLSWFMVFCKTFSTPRNWRCRLSMEWKPLQQLFALSNLPQFSVWRALGHMGIMACLLYLQLLGMFVSWLF